MRLVRRSIRGISPVLATLILIIIAVVAGILVYAWTMGWIGGQLGGAREELRIEGLTVSKGHVYITVKNTGTVKATIDKIYLDGLLYVLGTDIDRGAAKTLSLPYAWTYKRAFHIKLITARGTTLEGDYYAAEPESPYCLHFDGVDDYVQVADSDSLDLTEMTIMMWVKFPSVPPGSRWLLCKGTGGADSRNYVVGIYSSMVLWFGFYDDGGTWRSWSGTAPLTTDTWYQIVITYTSTASSYTMRFYINAVFDREHSSTTTGYTPQTNDDPLYIGDGPNWSTTEALIDEVRIYNRALTDAEISNSYDGRVYTDGLVLWLRFDEGSGGTTSDISGNENDGTLGPSPPTNAPAWEPGYTGPGALLHAARFTDIGVLVIAEPRRRW